MHTGRDGQPVCGRFVLHGLGGGPGLALQQYGSIRSRTRIRRRTIFGWAHWGSRLSVRRGAHRRAHRSTLALGARPVRGVGSSQQTTAELRNLGAGLGGLHLERRHLGEGGRGDGLARDQDGVLRLARGKGVGVLLLVPGGGLLRGDLGGLDGGAGGLGGLAAGGGEGGLRIGNVKREAGGRRGGEGREGLRRGAGGEEKDEGGRQKEEGMAHTHSLTRSFEHPVTRRSAVAQATSAEKRD